MRASAWWIAGGVTGALVVVLLLLRSEPRSAAERMSAVPSTDDGVPSAPESKPNPGGEAPLVHALAPVTERAAAPQPLDLDPELTEPAEHRGIARLRLLGEDGKPWRGGNVRLAVMPAAGEQPASARLPLAALNDVTWSTAPVADDGCVMLVVPPDQGCRVQAFTATSRCAPAHVHHGEAVTAVMQRVAELSGRVLDATGQPLAGAWVLLHADKLSALGKRWFVGNAGLDRRMPFPPRDPAIVVTDADGRFHLPHMPGLLVAEHPDALTALEWIGPDGGDVALDEGHVLEGDIVGPDGRPPAPGRGFVVRVTEGGEDVGTGQQPYSVQRLDPGARFHFRASGMVARLAFATLEDARGTQLDTRRGDFDANGYAHVTLHAPTTTSVVVRIPGSFAALARVELHRVDPPLPDGATETRLMLKRSADTDAWEGGVPWTGATDVVVASEESGTYPLARIVVDEEHTTFDLTLPAGRMIVSVRAAADSYPVSVSIRRMDEVVLVHSMRRSFDLEQPGNEAVLDHLAADRYLVTARRFAGSAGRTTA